MIDLKTRREDRIQRLYNELDGLWRRLGVPEGEMNAFVEANRGSMEENVQAVSAIVAYKNSILTKSLVREGIRAHA